MAETLDIELELLGSSLLPAESLESDAGPLSADKGDSPQTSSNVELTVSNADSGRRLVVSVGEGYPARSAVQVVLKGDDLDRDAAHKAEDHIQTLMQEHWDEADEYVSLIEPLRN